MPSILFIRSEKAFLPEISAYIKYFNRSSEFKAYDSSELEPDYSLEDFDILWEFKGIGGIRADNKILVHEYASLSTGSFPKFKNTLKTWVNKKPDLRIFLNENVKNGYHFHDRIKCCLRDMGIDESFLMQGTSPEKEYDYMYVGPVSKSRDIDRLLREFVKKPQGKICLVGNVDDDIYNEYKNNKDITLTGKVPYEEVPGIAAKGIYGINFIPNRYPYYLQTSTKLLEYLALGLKIVTVDYQWVREFEEANGCCFYKLDDKNLAFDSNEIKKFSYESNFQPEKYLWDQIFEGSGIRKQLLELI